MAREWLTYIRKKLSLSHDEVALMASISRQYYSMIENGDRNPSVKVAKKIARVLNFDWTSFYVDGDKATSKKSDNKAT